MDEQQIRHLVRQAIARHLGRPPAPAASVATPAPPPAPAAAVAPATMPAGGGLHPAAVQFTILRPPNETHCIIEPSVTCTHCGFCQCYGH
jgi:hypothetical protein